MVEDGFVAHVHKEADSWYSHALAVQRNGDDVARGFGAYSVLFDGQPVAVGEHKIADQPNVTLIRRC